MSKIVYRTLDFFEAFAARKAPLSLTDLVNILDVPLSSCHDVVRALEERGYLYEVRPRGGYYPTARLFQIAKAIVDNDPIAVQATAENALANKVADRIDGSITPSSELVETFPLVLANIQAHVLRALKDALVARTGGTLILSGLLTPQAAPLADEFVAAGLRLVAIRASKDDPQWSSAVLSR